MSRSLAVAALAVLLCSGAVSAEDFTYRGQLDDGGVPADGLYDFQLQLFADADATQPLGPPTDLHDVRVTGGAFAVDLALDDGLHGGWVQVAVRGERDAAFRPLTGITALASKGLTCPATWNLDGNAGVSPSQFLGTTDSQPLVLRIANLPALTLTPTAGTPHVVAGFLGNGVAAGLLGATVSGGGASSEPNRVNASYGTIGGGIGNEVSAGTEYGTVGGGRDNIAGGNVDSTVGGGASNHATGQTSTVGGGFNNIATAITTTIAGGLSNAATAPNAAVGGGESNLAGGTNASIAGGLDNSAAGTAAAVGGGYSNDASGVNATVSGGFNGTASGQQSTVAGGANNSASGLAAAVAGGSGNQAPGDYSSVAAGQSNLAVGAYSSVAGGRGNCAGGTYTWVGGRRAKTIAPIGSGGPCSLTSGGTQATGQFVWADATDHDFFGWESNSFAVRATGGVRFVTAVDPTSGGDTAGVTLAAGAGSWGSISDRNAKSDIAAADVEAVLERVAALPMYTWRWNTEAAGKRHMGPMAQDFHAAFGLNGADDRRIVTIDGIGVALTAVQGLNARLERELGDLRAHNADLAARHDELQARNEKLHSRHDQLQAQHEAVQSRHDALQSRVDSLLARQDADLRALREELAWLRGLVAPAVALGER